MTKSYVTTVDPGGIMLENILRVMSRQFFCKDTAAKIVGGVKKLENLIASGEIAAEKPTRSQNGKWYCNAADVLRHCRNMRK